MPTFRESWKYAWSVLSFRQQLWTTIPVLLLSLASLRIFLDLVEGRPGFAFYDPLLALFEPKDLTWVTFSLVYGGIVLAVLALSFHPWKLLLTMQAYIVMILLRIICVYFLPLEPPKLMIPLRDPVVHFLGSEGVLTKDLFFSGHVATMVVLALGIPGRDLRVGYFAGALAVGVCVILQHVHYTVDVLVAPCAAYTAYGIVSMFAPRT
jgi:hypothetical protein